MLQIPSRLPREYESPSPDHGTKYTGIVDTVLKFSNVLLLHQRVCHKIGDSMVRTSRFTVTARASLFTDHKVSDLSKRAKYKHLRTICEQTVDKSPSVCLFSGLMNILAWASRHCIIAQ